MRRILFISLLLVATTIHGQDFREFAQKGLDTLFMLCSCKECEGEVELNIKRVESESGRIVALVDTINHELEYGFFYLPPNIQNNYLLLQQWYSQLQWVSLQVGRGSFTLLLEQDSYSGEYFIFYKKREL